jgi:alkanesulfonate monooxygenase SsuD/methylene tetrahydromethanopterin reductase-like flavin-dependent oxidoreductase (luciferase family)
VGYAARHSYHFASGGPAAGIRPLVDQYWQTWETHRHDPDRLNGHVVAPKLGIFRQVCVADTDAEALAATHAAHGDWYRSIMKLWHDYDDHTYDAFFGWEPSLQGETILFGSPARVREQLARVLDVSGCNYVIGAFAWGTFPRPNVALTALVRGGGDAGLRVRRRGVMGAEGGEGFGSVIQVMLCPRIL